MPPSRYRETVYPWMTLEQAERFWTFVAQCSHGDACLQCCWVWRHSLTSAGYGRYQIWVAGQYRSFRAHRLVWLWRYGDIPPGLQVLHRCDNPPCCNPKHLWVGTQADNIQDMHEKGRAAVGASHGTHTRPERIARGEQQGSHKLTSEQVRAIRSLSGKASQMVIARQFGVSKTLVLLIHRKKIWTHLPEEV